MFTKLQRRILVVAGGLAIGYAVAFDRIHNQLAPQKSGAIEAFNSRGLFSGRKVGDCWVADKPTSRFAPGDIAIWELRAEIRPNTTITINTELWCNDHPVQFEEARIASEKLAGGWTSFGIDIPRDITGQCRLERQVQSDYEGGSDSKDFKLSRPINLMVEP